MAEAPLRAALPRSLPEINRSSVPRRATVRVYRRQRAIPSFRGDNRRHERDPYRDAGLRLRGRILHAGPGQRERPQGGRQLLALEARARDFARRWAIPESTTDLDAAHRARRHRSVHHRAAERDRTCPSPPALAGEAQPGLHQAAGPQRARSQADVRRRPEVGRDARLRRDRGLRALRGQGPRDDRGGRHRPRPVGALARIAQRPAQPALLGRREDRRRRDERPRLPLHRSRALLLRQRRQDRRSDGLGRHASSTARRPRARTTPCWC